MSDWQWRIGFLNGYGEAFWQELYGKIRRITKIVPVDAERSMFIKALPCVLAAEKDPQFDADRFVIGLKGLEIAEDRASELDRAWSGLTIIPANGAGRILK